MPAMGLRGRLALFFVTITVAPLALAVGVVQVQIDAQLRERAAGEVARAGSAAAALVEAARVRAGDLATDLGTRDDVAAALAGPAAARAWLADRPFDGRADVVVLATPGGQLLASSGRTPEGTDADALAGLAAAVAESPETATAEILLEVRVIPGVGLVATGVWFDDDLLGRVAHDPAPGSGAAFVADGGVLATTGPPPAPGDRARAGEVVSAEVAGEPVLAGVTDVPAAPAVELLVWTPTPPGPGLLLVVGVASAAGVAAVLGWLLAGAVVAPVRRAAEVARGVAGGDLSRQLSPSGGRELADLAHALNAMSAELAARLAEIERSRDELRRSLTRLGEALSGTLDLDRMLGVVVDTAATTLRTDGAVVLLLTPDGEALEAKAVRGRAPTGRLAASGGVTGHVLRTGRPVRLPGDPRPPAPAPGEPDAPFLLAVPLRGRDRTNGVLVLLREQASGEFAGDDLDTAVSIAAGVAVAVENIRLHEETQRLSLTNSVTGLWNNRYFEPQAEAEVARARRVNERGGARREVSVLAIDLDRFGRINKEYGQAAGDAALAEVGRRLEEATRAPDVVTHPHGEEFAVLLPDTGYEGSLRVAERMRAAVAELPIRVPHAGPGGHAAELQLTCSVGAATFPRHAVDPAGLYRAADRAMQLAKDRGRNQVVGAGDLPTAPAS